jgi:oxygen-dependent protoporphyrinogen oxidase
LRGDDDEVRAAVTRDLRDFLGLQGDPEWMVVRRYPAAMPQYRLGHVDRVREIFRRIAAIDGLELAGNAYGGIGLPDCVASGESAAQRILDGTPNPISNTIRETVPL